MAAILMKRRRLMPRKGRKTEGAEAFRAHEQKCAEVKATRRKATLEKYALLRLAEEPKKI